MADEIEVIEWAVEVKRITITVAGEKRELGYCGQTVYEQRLRALDLGAVIKAVNGLP